MRPDSLALLELLLERGQSYEDIAGVLGTEPGEVRERARTALGELGGSSPAPELTDYLLGQANPVERADAVRRLSDDPDQLALASRLSAELREIAPAARLPKLPQTTQASAPPARADLSAAPGTGLSRRQRLVMLGLLGAAIVLLAIVLGAGGAFDGSGDSGGGQTTGPESGADAVQVKLEPQGGGDAGGEGVFGLATADQLFLDLDVHGLKQPTPDQSYVVWLLLTPDQGYPISPFAVDSKGSFSDRFPIPRFAIPIAGRARFLDIGLSDRAELQSEVGNFAQSLNRAEAGAELPILDYSGDSVLRGSIPATGGPALLDAEGAGGS